MSVINDAQTNRVCALSVTITQGRNHGIDIGGVQM